MYFTNSIIKNLNCDHQYKYNIFEGNILFRMIMLNCLTIY